MGCNCGGRRASGRNITVTGYRILDASGRPVRDENGRELGTFTSRGEAERARIRAGVSGARVEPVVGTGS